MKKMVSLFLVLLMVMTAFPAFAHDDAEEVLLKVKAKIEIPNDLTEFSYTKNVYGNSMCYDFTWSDENYDKELLVSANVRGGIVSYNYYESVDYTTQRVLIDYTLSDAERLAKDTVKKFYQEYFSAESKDKLVLDDESSVSRYSGKYKTFIFTFDRVFDGIKTESNCVNVRVRATKDKMMLWSVDAALDDDAVFNEKNDLFTEDERADRYENVFPTEFYYKSDFSDEKNVILCYFTDKGYVSYATGEKVTKEDYDNFYNFEAGAAGDTTSEADSSYKKDDVNLRPNEQSEIEKMESLVKPSEIESKLREIRILNITDDMKMSDSYTYKRNETYFTRFTLESKDCVMNVLYNGETAEIMNIYSYNYNKERYDEAEEITDYELSNDIKSEIINFANVLASEKMQESEIVFDKNIMVATRQVNEIAFPENKVRVTYDKTANAVTRFTVNWDSDDLTFANPQDALDKRAARDILFEKAVLEDVWVKSADGYEKAVTVKDSVSINAVSGEEMFAYKGREKVKYTDVDTHWAKEAIEVLFEHDIYLEGDKFQPDSPINQADMVRLFSACRENGMISDYMSDEDVVKYAYEQKYIDECDKDGFVTRSEAFKTMAKILGYGEIASFDIYKSSYMDLAADGNAEILKALGMLTGEYARGDDLLTRGEAAVMVYRYLKK